MSGRPKKSDVSSAGSSSGHGSYELYSDPAGRPDSYGDRAIYPTAVLSSHQALPSSINNSASTSATGSGTEMIHHQERQTIGGHSSNGHSSNGHSRSGNLSSDYVGKAQVDPFYRPSHSAAAHSRGCITTHSCGGSGDANDKDGMATASSCSDCQQQHHHSDNGGGGEGTRVSSSSSGRRRRSAQHNNSSGNNQSAHQQQPSSTTTSPSIIPYLLSSNNSNNTTSSTSNQRNITTLDHQSSSIHSHSNIQTNISAAAVATFSTNTTTNGSLVNGRPHVPRSHHSSRERSSNTFRSHHLRNRSDNGQYRNDDEALINKILPDETLLRIFSHLDVVSLCRCAQVDKKWNKLALDGSNWQYIDLFAFQVDIQPSVVENISLRCGGFLKKLSLRGCQNVSDGALKTFALNCRNIENINLENCKHITDAALESLGLYSNKLTVLDLNECLDITDTGLVALAEGCSNLRNLNISWCNNITDTSIGALARSCPQIHVFSAAGCTQVHDDAFVKMFQSCTQLEKLNIKSCTGITDTSVIGLARHCPFLQSLSLSMCTQLTDESLVALSHSCHDIRTLEVAGCSQMTDVGFELLFRQCHHLERLDLEECIQVSDVTVVALASNCPNISRLSLSHCEMVTDEGIRALGSSPCASEHLTVLELDNCPLITDQSLQSLLGCQALERIDLYDCQLITRSGIKMLKRRLPAVRIQAYFAPVTPPAPNPPGGPRRYCRCCNII